MPDETALGLVETQGLVAALEAADAMTKAAAVRLVTAERTEAALVTIQVVGEVAAVRAAVEAGRSAAERVGRVVAVHVIPRPDDSVRDVVLGIHRPVDSSPGSSGSGPAAPVPATSGSSGTGAASGAPAGAARASAAKTGGSAFEGLTVRQLRARARTIPDFPLQGREIASARKEELVELLRRYA